MAAWYEKVSFAAPLPDEDLGTGGQVPGHDVLQVPHGRLHRAPVAMSSSPWSLRPVSLLILLIGGAACAAPDNRKVLSQTPVLADALASHAALEVDGRILDAAQPAMFIGSVDCSGACYALIEPGAPPVRDGAGGELRGTGGRSLIQAHMPTGELLWNGKRGWQGHAMRIDLIWKATVNAIFPNGIFDAYIADERLHRSAAAWNANPSAEEESRALPGLTAPERRKRWVNVLRARSIKLLVRPASARGTSVAYLLKSHLVQIENPPEDGAPWTVPALAMR
jgi:hypothetical protein